jgi:predicted nucleic acid-binding protein
MAVVLDTSVVLAAYDTSSAEQERVRRWLDTLDDDLVTTPLIVTELDRQLPRFGGRAAQEALWADLERGAYNVRWWSTAMAETLVLARERPAVGLADASLLALARLLGTDRIATLDLRHFRQARTVGGEPFILLPLDDHLTPETTT